MLLTARVALPAIKPGKPSHISIHKNGIGSANQYLSMATSWAFILHGVNTFKASEYGELKVFFVAAQLS